MRKLIITLAVAALLAGLAAPGVAYAGESKYARIGVNGGASPSSTYKWYHANQGSIEESYVSVLGASIQNRSSSVYSWVTRKTVWAVPGGSCSSTVNWTSAMYWRLGLTGLAGYGIINSY